MTSLFLLWMNQRLDRKRMLAMNICLITRLLILLKRSVVSRSVNFLLSAFLKNIRLKHDLNNFNPNPFPLDLEQQKYIYNAFIVIPIRKIRFIFHFSWNCNSNLVTPKWDNTIFSMKLFKRCCIASLRTTNNSMQVSRTTPEMESSW